jgi:Family of unknown function (DUF6516)
LIESYFQSFLLRISSSAIVQARQITLDARTSSLGFVRGTIIFSDESQLHIRELVETEPATIRIAYSYHYQQLSGDFIFRYDNTPHFPHLPTHPHHKHVGSEQTVIAAEPPDLNSVLDEIERMPHWN